MITENGEFCLEKEQNDHLHVYFKFYGIQVIAYKSTVENLASFNSYSPG